MKAPGIMIAGLMAATLTLGACGSKDEGSAATAEGGGVASGDGDAAATAAAQADPCSYITPEEMEAITTDKVQEAVPSDNSCKYRSNPDDGLSLTVDLTDGERQMNGVRKSNEMLGGIGAEVAKKGGVGADAAAAMKADGSAVPQLGDEAAWGPASILYIRKGTAFVQIIPPMIHDPATHPGYPIVPTDEKRKIAIAVAEKVLAKL